MNIHQNGYHGIHLPDYNIGLDSDSEQMDHIFISHAHADHVPRNRKLAVYATPPTAALMRARGFTGEITELPFQSPLEIDEATVTFFPAGHILGSAMTYVETPDGNLLYTGDYRNPPSPASEGFICPEKVDYFITEATFSLPIYKWKSHEVLFEEIRDFARKARKHGDVPVFLTYNLGKAQEVMMALEPLGLPVQIHGAGFPLCKVYESFGLNLGNYSRYDRDSVEEGILITPLSSLDAPMLQGLRNKRVAYCSGWAALESRRSQILVDKLIPISDHIDFFELLKLCEKLNPRHVYITHTPNPDVVQYYLSQMNIPSSPLGFAVKEED